MARGDGGTCSVSPASGIWHPSLGLRAHDKTHAGRNHEYIRRLAPQGERQIVDWRPIAGSRHGRLNPSDCLWREAQTRINKAVLFPPSDEGVKRKTPPPEGGGVPSRKRKSRRRPTLARASPALPSAKGPLTSVFGMGTGIAAPLWPPAEDAEKSGTKENHDPHTGREECIGLTFL